MAPSVRFTTDQSIGVITIDAPPVNAISAAVTAGLQKALDAFEADASLQALVLHGAGRTFVAGGDIREFSDPSFSTSPLNRALERLEAQTRPVVAALHGHVLGGGLELAMACHFRVARPGTRLGLPEIKLGLIPGSLGTQRLPRLVPLATALEMMRTGQPIDAEQAHALGLVDAVDANGSVLAAALDFARATVAAGTAPVPTNRRPPRNGGINGEFFSQAFAKVVTQQAAYPAARAVVEAVHAASTLPFNEGEQVEAKLFEECRRTPESAALRHLFFAEREAAKIPGLTTTSQRPVRKVGIVGAGTMGGGIAMNFANAGIPTVIVEVSDAALQRGLALIRKNYEASVAKGRITAEQMDQRMGLLNGALDYAPLADCDLVIEAVFENLVLKQEVCAKLGAVAKAGAIIATNTSTLDVDVLARATGRPADVVGMHFFSPANVMRLLEIVRGADTAPEVLATVMKLATTIGKVPVVSGVCYGFIGNRMAEVYMREAEFLIMEGAEPAQVDAAVESLGFAMGPCRMLDMAGVDVGAKTVIEYGKAGGLPPDPRYRALVQRLFALGRFGQKTGAGYYRYEGRTPVADPEVAVIAAGLAEQHGIVRRQDISTEEITERLLYPLFNEGLKIADEGIAYRLGDIDMVWVAGYGFPDFRGGPMWMANRIGLDVIANRMAHYADAHGNTYGYWTPARSLTQRALNTLKEKEPS